MLGLDSVIYRPISEVRYSFSEDPYEYSILNFIKGFLYGNAIDETILWEWISRLFRARSSLTRQLSSVDSLLNAYVT